MIFIPLLFAPILFWAHSLPLWILYVGVCVYWVRYSILWVRV